MISQNSKLKVTYGDFDTKRLKLLLNVIIFAIMLLFNRQKAFIVNFYHNEHPVHI